VRLSVIARNVFVKKFAGVKIHQQEHILKQVPAQVLANLKGVSEYGLHWLVNALQLLVGRVGAQSKCLKELASGLKILQENARVG
jgi:hypothetical protein